MRIRGPNGNGGKERKEKTAENTTKYGLISFIQINIAQSIEN
jgi:hypothetical protein